jgi:outer membrane immunogenic protein
MKNYIIASALLLATVTGAQAADVVVQETVPAYNWSGIYVGAQAGYAWSDARYDAFDYATVDYDPNGLFGGAYAGYNYQLQNNIVLGIDADINFSGIDSDGSLTWASGSDPDDHIGHSKVKWTGAIRGRVGYALDRFMPYIAGGLSVARFQFDLDHDGTGNMDFEEERSLTGWNLGAGFDYAATDNIIVRAEYRYSDFGSRSFDNDWADDSKIDLKTHDIRLGVAYKF